MTDDYAKLKRKIHNNKNWIIIMYWFINNFALNKNIANVAQNDKSFSSRPFGLCKIIHNISLVSRNRFAILINRFPILKSTQDYSTTKNKWDF